MRVVYADSVFTLNAVMDYLILTAVAKLSGQPQRRGRYLLTALLGGGYAVAVFLPGCGWLGSWWGKLLAGGIMAAAAFWGQERLLRLILLTFGISCGLAGSVLALAALTGSTIPMAGGVFYTDVDVRVLWLAAGGAYLLLTVVFRASARQGLRGDLLRVRLYLSPKRSVRLTALRDSGNSLRDPISGQPALVVSYQALTGVWPPPVDRLMEGYPRRGAAELLPLLHEAAPELRFCLLPYRSVGVTDGLLAAFHCPLAEIGGQRYRNLTVAVSPTALGDGYSALWGTETLGERFVDGNRRH